MYELLKKYVHNLTPHRKNIELSDANNLITKLHDASDSKSIQQKGLKKDISEKITLEELNKEVNEYFREQNKFTTKITYKFFENNQEETHQIKFAKRKIITKVYDHVIHYDFEQGRKIHKYLKIEIKGMPQEKLSITYLIKKN